MLIDKSNVMPIILEKFPEFRGTWEEHLSSDFANIGLCIDLGVFAGFTADNIIEENWELVSNIFRLIEESLAEGESELKGLIETCYLEYLINISQEGGKIQLISYKRYLGPKTINFMLQNDIYFDRSTPGLWIGSIEGRIDELMKALCNKIQGVK